MFRILILGLALCTGLQAAAFDYETFAQRLRDKKITTVEDALGELPAEFWQYYVLMRESRSTQGASGEYPRVILAGIDGRLLVAFNGDPKLPGHDNIEMIQVRDEGRRFELRQIRFPDDKNGLKEVYFSAANPRECRSCHRNDPRPNWDMYSTWTGAYGEDDDGLRDSERTSYLDFVKRHGQDPRYHRLYREGSETAPFGGDVIELDTRPNLFFTKLVARWNAKRMSARLREGLQGRDRLVPVAALAECSDFSPAAKERVARVLHASVTDLQSSYDLRGHLLTARGIDPFDWSMVFTAENAPPPVSPYRFDRYFDGIFDQRDMVEYDLIQKLKVDYPELEPIAGFSGYAPDDGIPARRKAMYDSVNALGGVPEPGTGQICQVIGDALTSEKP